MNNNVKIAAELVRIATMIVSAAGQEDDEQEKEDSHEGETVKKLIDSIYSGKQVLSGLRNKMMGDLSSEVKGPMAKMKLVDMLTIIADITNYKK